jgi:hypothetical protein
VSSVTIGDGLFLLAIVGLGVTIAIGVLAEQRKKKRELEAAAWPTVSGVVESICSKSNGRRAPLYSGGLLFSYSVNGEFYSAEHYFKGLYYTPEEAEYPVKKWIGEKIQIHYNPADPQESYFLEVYP